MEISNCLHRSELLSAIEKLFPKASSPNRNVASGIQLLSHTPASLSGTVDPVLFVPIYSGSCTCVNQNPISTGEGSVPSASQSFVRQTECGSSFRNINRIPNPVCERSDCDSATSPSQVGSFGLEMGRHAETDIRVVSHAECSERSSRVRQMNVHGSSSNKNVESSKLRMDESKTYEIQKPDTLDSLGPHMRRKHHINDKNRSVNRRKLILTLEPGQISDTRDEDLTNKIKSRCVKLDNEVTVKPMEEECNYTITFQDDDSASKALKKFKDEGFCIRYKYPPRPSPRLIIKYKALRDLPLKIGKSLR